MAVLLPPDKLIEHRFQMFGPNKRQEIVRLVFEISKREHLEPDVIIDGLPSGSRSYAAVKDHFVKRRFPDACERGEKISESFASLDILPAHAMPLSRRDKVPAPKRIYIEDGLEKFELVRRLEAKFPQACFSSIRTYKDHCAGVRPDISAYNRRTEELLSLIHI